MYRVDYKFVAREFEERLRQAEWDRLVDEVRAHGNGSKEGVGPRLGRALAALKPALEMAHWPTAAG
jgi:hypothetical protein